MNIKMDITKPYRLLFQKISDIVIQCLLPGKLVKIKGTGVPFSGLYFVESVTHEISEEGYIFTILCITQKGDTLRNNDANHG